MNDMPQHEYSLLELIKCAGREVALRKAVYPGRVAAGKVTRALAGAEIGRMQAIVEKLKALHDGVPDG
jgi:hypothetical protein